MIRQEEKLETSDNDFEKCKNEVKEKNILPNDLKLFTILYL